MTTSAHHAKTILLVDAEPGILDLLTLALGDAGFKAYAASTTTQALALCAEHRPAVALVDADIAGKSSVPMFIAALCQEAPGIRCCLVDAGHSGTTEELARAGVVHHFEKPFSLGQLIQTLEQEFLALLSRRDTIADDNRRGDTLGR